MQPKKSIEQQNKVSRMSQPLSQNPTPGPKNSSKKTPLPPLQPKEIQPTEITSSSLSEHIIRMPLHSTDIPKSPVSDIAVNIGSPRQIDQYTPVNIRDNQPSELARASSSYRNSSLYRTTLRSVILSNSDKTCLFQ